MFESSHPDKAHWFRKKLMGFLFVLFLQGECGPCRGRPRQDVKGAWGTWTFRGDTEGNEESHENRRANLMADLQFIKTLDSAIHIHYRISINR